MANQALNKCSPGGTTECIWMLVINLGLELGYQPESDAG